ncbi:sensor histidine kinase [Williamsia sterculiae]|uniref:sensor histidine kinase n=1 Tax=Williamsia sterculiae TaxID=1344003 RepID=UPI001F2916DC|nr:sensor histidine kinase [Williamsia sterculiae]
MSEHLKAWRDLRWVFGAIWLLFLTYPYVGMVTSTTLSTPVRIAGLVLLTVFAMVYTAMCVYVMVPCMRSGDRGGHHPVLWVTGLGCLAAGLAPIIGQQVLGLGPYFMALALFLFPAVLSAATVMGIIAASVVLPELIGGWSPDPSTTVTLIVVGLVLVVMRSLQMRERLRDLAAEQERALQKQLAVVAERERVARDVHDILGHSLTVMALKSELAARLVDVDPARAKVELNELHELSRAALGEVRTTVGDLRAPDLHTELRSARSALDAAEIRAEIPVGDGVHHDPVLAWVLREAVTNVVRHSDARTCRVALRERGIEIVDDGRGINGSCYGNGLRGLDERVRDAGGVLEVSAVDGSGSGEVRPGTRVRVSLP